jgi:hypothetical protein
VQDVAAFLGSRPPFDTVGAKEASVQAGLAAELSLGVRWD